MILTDCDACGASGVETRLHDCGGDPTSRPTLPVPKEPPPTEGRRLANQLRWMAHEAEQVRDEQDLARWTRALRDFQFSLLNPAARRG